MAKKKKKKQTYGNQVSKKRHKNQAKGVATRTTKAAKRGENQMAINQAEEKKKMSVRTKELIVVLVSVVVCVGMLLPSFAMITGQTGNTQDASEQAQQIVTEYDENYEAAKAKVEENPDDLQAQLDFANYAYQYASWLPYESMFDTEEKTDEELKAESAERTEKMQTLYSDALSGFNKWLDGQEDKTTDEAKNIQVSIAEITYAQGNADEAENMFNTLANDYNWPTAYLGLAQIYQQKGDTDKALETYQKAIDNADLVGDTAESIREQAQNAIDAINSEDEKAETETESSDGSGDVSVEVTDENGEPGNVEVTTEQ